MLTLAAVADNKKIKLDRLDVQISFDIQTGKIWSTCFNIRIDLGDALTRRENAILFNSARWCEVSKLLSGENKFTYELVDGTAKERIA